jgi:hypothetical protein
MAPIRDLLALLDDRLLVDAVFGDHPANDPSVRPIEIFTAHGCGVLALALASLTGRPINVLYHAGEPLHAALSTGDRLLDADGLHTPDALRRAWASITDAPLSRIELRPYDGEAEAWYAASIASGEVERLATRIAAGAPALVAALRA